MRCRPPILTAAVSAGALAFLAAGCGGGEASPGIASIAASTTTGSTTTTSSTQDGSGSGGKVLDVPGGANAHFSIAMNAGNAALGAKFSACMRKHGVHNFPDPNGQGVIQFGSGIEPNSPTFKSARTACQKLLPNGGQPTPQQQARAQQQLLAFSKCMRAHGIKDFPDPSSGGLRLKVGPGSDLNPNNAQFAAAQQACQGKLPFKGSTLRAGG
jgi:hypothetical protein